MNLEICILAAGMGSRMKSDVPKVLQTLAGKPMLAHLLDTVATLAPSRIHVVIGKGADQVKSAFADRDINWVLQAEQQGTGHAVMQALPFVADDARLLILLGDAPLVSATTMMAMINEPADLAVLTVDQPDPTNYGRILRSESGTITRIVEERDASIDERAICEINTGVMAADANLLSRWTLQLNTDNDQSEYLLTDIVAIAGAEQKQVLPVKTMDAGEVQGINTFSQLAVAERYHQRKQAETLMQAGVHLMDPARIDIRGTLTAGRNVQIDIGCIFEGKVSLGDNVRIGPFCVIRNSHVGDGAEIKAHTMLDDASVGDHAAAGPYARLRPGATLLEGAAVGNFVEIKKATLGKGSKASHLTYLGDATIGDGVNIGAGTITCNYDGVNKHQTVIEDGVFVGSNSSLVAPVTLGKNATIGAGSTITKPVKADQLAIARGRQAGIDNWPRPTKKDK